MFNQKTTYDQKHQPLFMKVGEWAMLRLHKGYNLFTIAKVTRKLTQQYIDSFRIVEKVGRLAYRLDMPPDWRIISMAQLKPILPLGKDPFARLIPSNPPSVFVEENTNNFKSFEVERLLNKWHIKKGKSHAIEYLVR